MKKLLPVLTVLALVFCLVLPASAAGSIRVTKSPTAETVGSGGNARFVVAAEGYDSIVWHFGPNTGREYLVADIRDYFANLWAYLSNGNKTLDLNNIPASFSGWKVTAEFLSGSASEWSQSAAITVTGGGSAVPAAPTITQQPEDVTTADGRVQVTASASNANAVLVYQWYRNTVGENKNGELLPNGKASSYIPASGENAYYYCEIRCRVGSELSAPAVTRAACVSLGAPIVTTAPSTELATEATTAVQTEPAQTAPAATEQQTAPQTQPVVTQPAQVSAVQPNSLIRIIVIVIIVITVLCIIATIIIMRTHGQDDEDDEEEEDEEDEDGSPAEESDEEEDEEYETLGRKRLSDISLDKDPEMADLDALLGSLGIDEEAENGEEFQDL